MKSSSLAALLLAAASLAGCETQAVGTGAATQAKELLPVSIRTAQGVRNFRVEVARTDEEQQRGLMFRTGLPEDGGMLFPSDTAIPRSFWMKNTMISLDLIFIREDGSIARIAEEAVPQTLDPIASGEPVIAVLEIAGGKSAALGIAEGDRVSWEGGPPPAG